MSDDSHELMNLPDEGVTDDLYANPGLPEHAWRPTDVDPKLEKRAERQVATLMTLSAICTILLLVSYFTVDKDATFAGLGAQNLALGLSLPVPCCSSASASSSGRAS